MAEKKKPVAGKAVAPAKTAAAPKDDYTASNVKVLEGLEGIRKRFDMYIGDRAGGVNHLVKEVVTNSIDEFMNGHAGTVLVELLPDNYISVLDDGRGIPVDPMVSKNKEIDGKPAVEILFTNVHAGGKFDKSAFKVSAGKNGVGVKAVNALSSHTIVEVFKGGIHYRMEFALGKVTKKLEQVGKTKLRGSRISFKPDPKIFREDTEFNADSVKRLLEEFSYVNGGLKLTYVDKRIPKTGETLEFYHPEGIRDLVRDMSGKSIIGNLIYISQEFGYEMEDEDDDGNPVTVKGNDFYEVAFDYNSGSDFQIRTFVNGISTNGGGTHESGFKMALSTIVSKFVKESGLLPKKDADLKIEGDDTREGLTVVINLKHHLPEFRGQTKDQLSNKEVQGHIQKMLNSGFVEFLNENPDVAKVIATKAIQAARGREAAKNAREREISKSSNSPAFASLNSISKLSDCKSKDTSKNEVFIVEGDSAGGSANEGRDPEFQAVFALKGKPLNTHAADMNRVLNPKDKKGYNKEISDLVSVLGTDVDEHFDIEKAKYGDINLMTDADVDGKHIQSLLLNFIYKHMRGFIEAGRVYISLSPLYRVKEARQEKYVYLLDDREYEDYIHDKIIKAFKVMLLDGTGKVMDTKSLRKFLRETNGYVETLERFVSKHGIDMDVVEMMIEYWDAEEVSDEMLDQIRDNYGLEWTLTEEGEVEVEGFCKTKYHNFYITDELWGEIGKLREKYDQFSTKYVAVGKDGEEWDESHFLGGSLKVMYDECSPKERNRLKGLGESDPEELWETTLNPETRRRIRVTIADFEKADDVMESLMGKKAELRRDFLDANKHRIGELDI